jgi:hypothetical protein
MSLKDDTLLFTFNFQGTIIKLFLTLEGLLTYEQPFIYRGKELEAHFSILQTDENDMLTCMIVSLANDNELKITQVLSHNCSIQHSCQSLVTGHLQQMSIGKLRTFLGSNFPVINSKQ